MLVSHFLNFAEYPREKTTVFRLAAAAGGVAKNRNQKLLLGTIIKDWGEIRPEIERPSLAVESNNRERRFVSSSAMQASIGVELRRRVSFCQSQEERNAESGKFPSSYLGIYVRMR